jgi:predicted RNase H-like nuclease (RuvC/YqgF family)
MGVPVSFTKAAEEDWRVKEATHLKEATRHHRIVESLTNKLEASDKKVAQCENDLLCLRGQHELVEQDMAMLKTECQDLKKDRLSKNLKTLELKERRRAKVEKLTTEIIDWRDSTLAQVASCVKQHQKTTSSWWPSQTGAWARSLGSATKNLTACERLLRLLRGDLLASRLKLLTGPA